MTIEKDIKSVPIYDKQGRLLGNITGRKEDVDRFSNNDLRNQLERDRERHKENLRRK